MSVPPAKILEFTDSLIKFAIHNKIISKEILGRFVTNLKTSIQTNTKLFLKRPKVLSEKSEASLFNPLIYKKFLNHSLIEFSMNSFKIDFRELLINNMSFGNPIGCLILVEASLNANDDSFAAEDLSEAFLYLITFGVVNESINPVVFRGLSRLFKKVSENAESGLYMNTESSIEGNPIFDGVLRAEFWASHLYELSLQIDECRDLFYQVMYHYVIRHESFTQTSRLIRRLVNWLIKDKVKKPLENLYMIQSVNFLHHVRMTLENVQEGKEAAMLPLFNVNSSKYLSKNIFNSILFFTENYLVKVKKNKTEKALVSFLTQKKADIAKWKGGDLEKGIIYLLRENLSNLAKLKNNEKVTPLNSTLIKGKEPRITVIMAALDALTQAQLPGSSE
jgi:hypothetical protein